VTYLVHHHRDDTTIPTPTMITEPATDTPDTRTPPAAPRRRRLLAAVRALGVTIAVLGVITLVWPGLFGAWSARAGQPAVPRSIELPWRWQASVDEDPPGPASVVATADQPSLDDAELAATADDRGDAAHQIEVVGRNGVYRAIYPTAGRWQAGRNVHLSPDGRYLALAYLDDPTTTRQGPTLVDLTSGEVRVLRTAGLPARSELIVLGWSPDGGALLLASVTGANARVSLLELAGGAPRTLAQVSAEADPRQWRVAFSPDGRRIAFAAHGALHLVDDRGEQLWTVPLTEGRLLAGSAAFTPDGSRIALVRPMPCRDVCAGAPPWVVTYVDSANGRASRGPELPPLEAAAVRAVGWSPREDGTSALVVVRYLPEPPAAPTYGGPAGGGAHETPAPESPADARPGVAGPADLYELATGHPPRLLLDAPYEVTDLDVAADLVRAGRFEGAPTTPSLLPIDPTRMRPLDIVLAVAIVGALAAVIAVLVSLTGRPVRVLTRRVLRRGALAVPGQRRPAPGS
jgi:hypothetical protein